MPRIMASVHTYADSFTAVRTEAQLVSPYLLVLLVLLVVSVLRDLIFRNAHETGGGQQRV